jgi:predicted PurR-regulated permease PerM
MLERIRRAGMFAWGAVGLAALLALALYLGWVVRVIWPPLILGGAIVFLLNPIVTRLHGRGLPRALATGLSYLGVAGVVALAVLLIAPLARSQYDDLVDEWPDIRDKIEEEVDELSERSEDGDWPIVIPTYDELEDAISGNAESEPELDANGNGTITPAERQAFEEARQERFADQLDTAQDLALRVFHVGIIFVLAPIIAFYLLVDLPHIRKVAQSLVPENARGDVMVVARRLNRAIGGYFRGQLAIAFIVGTMASIGLAIIGLPFWIIVGMIAGLFNMIPLIGPWVGAIPGIVIALTTGGGISQAVGVAIVMTIAQQIDNHFISPLVMQRAVKLHPAVVMMALLAGGTLGGFFGLLLAVPVTAVLKIISSHLWRTYVLGEPLSEIEAEWEAEDAEPAGPGGVVEKVGDDPEAEAGVTADAAVTAPPPGSGVEAPDPDATVEDPAPATPVTPR